VNNLLLLVIQIFYPWQNLTYYQLSLFFLNLFVFFKIIVQIRSWAQLQNSAKWVMVNLDCIKMFNNSAVIQLLVNLVLPQCMFNVIIFNLITPAIVKRVDLACHFSAHFYIKRLIHLRKSTFTQYWENQISVIQNSKSFLAWNSTILALLLIPYSFIFQQILTLFFV